ncbi:GNAT family N-acetyltransferase [Clostridium sp. P21]|uniref:GNAT family N-acetyltransferase n=1 Tax=Clostridium muellerianum TaxID=2716538 RepID=A0A7Y0HQL3_9CLOT|nr:GNAT family N-acetyltransferase [Clostridium muellerianum]NMM64291.1 GNAT family N-acetyltransferase [Clostridium muellerianum]
MLKLNTERLLILPLDEYNLRLSIDDFNKMEKNLGLTITDKNIGYREKNVFKIRLNSVKNNPMNYMWYTTWIIILKSENRIVGHIMLKGYPNENGEVIIGYYSQDEYRCKGHMTEALRRLTQWAFLNSDVKCIIADTLKNNIPSQKVLQKIGMVFYMEDDECFWWKLER